MNNPDARTADRPIEASGRDRRRPSRRPVDRGEIPLISPPPSSLISHPNAPTILLDHSRWAYAKGVSVNYDKLSRALRCSTLDAKDALFEFCYCLAQATRTDK